MNSLSSPPLLLQTYTIFPNEPLQVLTNNSTAVRSIRYTWDSWRKWDGFNTLSCILQFKLKCNAIKFNFMAEFAVNNKVVQSSRESPKFNNQELLCTQKPQSCDCQCWFRRRCLQFFWITIDLGFFPGDFMCRYPGNEKNRSWCWICRKF